MRTFMASSSRLAYITGRSFPERSLSADRVVHAEAALDGDHVLGPLEGRGSRRAALPRPANGLEELLEARRRDDPHHHELVGALVDDLVPDVVAEEARGARHQPVRDTVDHHAPLPAEADLQLHLAAVRVLAAAS